jgi:1-acyl-sn-glycerol-3-phosphate acyltransferase
MLPKIGYNGPEVSWADLDEAREQMPTMEIPAFNRTAAAVRRAVHPLLLETMVANRKKHGLDLKIENEGEHALPDDGRPILFVANHTNGYDMPYTAEVIRNHFYVLPAVDGHTNFTRFLFNLNGVTHWVERGNSERAKVSRAIGGLATIEALRHGVDCLVYPEGTWNQHYRPELLGFWPGAIIMAHYGNAHILPLVSEYTNDTCYFNKGEPFEITDFSGPVSAKKELRDIMLKTKKRMRAEYGVDEKEWYSLRTQWLKDCPQIDPNYEKLAVWRDSGIDLPTELFETGGQ